MPVWVKYFIETSQRGVVCTQEEDRVCYELIEAWKYALVAEAAKHEKARQSLLKADDIGVDSPDPCRVLPVVTGYVMVWSHNDYIVEDGFCLCNEFRECRWYYFAHVVP